MCSEIQKIINLFIEKCGEPDSNDSLVKYVSFVFENVAYINSNEYCEKHHILPRSTFSEFTNSEWNIVNLTYPNHIIAHELLFKAYPTRQNQFTLNFMKSQLTKNKELISTAARSGWKKLKLNKEKFEKFKEARRNYMINAPSVEHKKRGLAAWKAIKSDDLKYSKFCDSAKKSWTSERRLNQSKKMSDWVANNPGKISASSKKYWSEISKEDREKFKTKVTESLNTPEVKKKISSKLKNKWADSKFKEKMKNRKTYLQKLEIISPTGEKYYRAGVIEMSKEFGFSPYLVRKFTNSEKPVSSKNVNNKHVQATLGWTFKKIN